MISLQAHLVDLSLIHIFILAYYLLNFAKKKRISFKDIFKPIYIAPIGIVSFFISKSKIQQYLSWGASQSIRVGVHSVGLKIANDHFPFEMCIRDRYRGVPGPQRHNNHRKREDV